jgi:uncharacterized protein (DUF433 family)
MNLDMGMALRYEPLRAESVSSPYTLCPERTMDWREHITVDPNVCHGKACVKGTRIPVAVILANLAGGVSEEELLKTYPVLGPDAIPATLAYAAELAEERVVTLPV